METTESAQPLVILNPAARHGKVDLYRMLVRSRAEQEHAEYIETSAQGEARERARQAAMQNRPVIIVGGDGSVNEVVNGLLSVSQRVPLGIVPAGSGCDFAWNTLKLPHDPLAAVERAFNGRLIDVDAGRVNERYFANSFSVGLDADIAVAAGSLKKYLRLSGMPLYYTSTLRQLLFGYHRCPWLNFSLDDDREGHKQEQRFVLMAITTGPTYGAGFRINPQADHTDGLFDICTIRYIPLLLALHLLPSVQKGEHSDLPEVTFYHARTVHIESRKPVNIQMDGETMSASSFDATILPKALWVRV
ncbi:diacylglycerol/lipid kinase family protein [Dictyobacter formicarum]|uniref:Diacylglycerol kinase n=1 Tax=Dictyobacter formicarum TaxID=2778368 RepID=A0ABQ3VE34_9CHLR|nr:diacylglycerol kinase family protein [Dictyobacter formicarum]GHO84407.1 diacylglycerol kinase [Dictyobacter formicarum]